MIKFSKINEINAVIEPLDKDGYMEFKTLYNTFSYYVANYQFTPMFKNHIWDGKIHYINLHNGIFQLGLLKEIINECALREIKYQIDEELLSTLEDKEYTEEQLDEVLKDKHFYNSKTNEEIFPREDQLAAVNRAIKLKKCINIMPTGSGKSLSITLECLYYITKGYRCIIIVPTKDLVLQFENDIKSYATHDGKIESWLPKTQTIFAGKDKTLQEYTNIVITTWQSLSKVLKEDEEYLSNFNALIVDECHTAKAKVLKTIIEHAVETEFRTGWTGTLCNDKTDATTVISMLGPSEQIITTQELMDKNVVAHLKIMVVKLNYDEKVKKDVLYLDFQQQEKFYELCKPRTKKVLEMVGKLPFTGLLFFKKIAHGEETYKIAREMFPDRNIYLIYGGHFICNDKKYKTFEDVKSLIEKEKNAIVLANYQLASTGINLKNLHYICFYTSAKSYVRVLQSIGRGMRINSTKNKVLLLDLVDNIQIKNKTCYAIKHFQERYKIYLQNNFTHSFLEINIPNDDCGDAIKELFF